MSIHKTVTAADIEAAVKTFIDDRYYYLPKVSETREIEIFADYRDEMGDADVGNILRANDPKEALFQYLEDAYMDSVWATERQVTDEVAKSLARPGALCEGMTVEEIEDILGYPLREEVQDNICIKLPIEHFMKQKFRCSIMLDTGNGDGDFTADCLTFPACYGREEGEYDPNASLLWLCRQQGYQTNDVVQRFARATEEKDIDNHFLKSVYNELLNLPSGCSTLTFLVEMTLEQLIRINCGMKDGTLKSITLDKGVMCGLFNPWEGGGSLLDVKCEKDIVLPVDVLLEVCPDKGSCRGRYSSVDGVYGLIGSCWRDAVKQIEQD